MTLAEHIKSLRETVGKGYTRPDPARLDVLVKALWDTPHALEYLRSSRGLLDKTIAHFKLGFDTSTNAITIPIFKGDLLVNIKYRLLDNPEGQRYTGERDAEMWLFNEDGVGVAMRERKGVLIVEGEFDCMAVWQTGNHNVVAPSGGKDSFGLWLAELDKVKKIFIGFDNDAGGKQSATKMAERLGEERCLDINYQDCKDANEFMLKHTKDEFIDLFKSAKNFAQREYKNMGEVIDTLALGERRYVESEFMPKIRFKNGWMAVISGRTNVGKTSYTMNIANELADKGIPVLVMPFERGIETVGERLLQVRYKSTEQDFDLYTKDEWDVVRDDVKDLPIYFAMPKRENVVECMVKSARFFDAKVIIVDHLDYLVRQIGSGSRAEAISDTLQQMKRMAEDNGIILLIVSHVRKPAFSGFTPRTRIPDMEELKGSSSSYQDSEAVLMLSQTENDGEILVDVQKNKGPMTRTIFDVNTMTGVFVRTLKTVPTAAEKLVAKKEAEKIWKEGF